MNLDSPFIIRPARDDEFPRVCELTDIMYESYGMSSPDDSWHQGAHEWYSTRDISKSHVVVAEDPDTNILVASGVALIYDDIVQWWLPNGQLGTLRWMSTLPEYRNKGIGKQVLDELTSWLKSQGVPELFIHSSEEAMDLYRRNGFADATFPAMWKSLLS